MKPEEVFKPLSEAPQQVFLGRGLHTLGLIDWIVKQIGPSDIVVTTFSTSIDFLSGFKNIKSRGLIRQATMVADVKASKKTQQLFPLLDNCFDNIYLAENHSKVVVLRSGSKYVSIITSQNNTYGGRIECTLVSTDADIARQLYAGIFELEKHSLKRK